ncbi:MAG: carbamoyltransferase C-terminal domain-containing protein [Reyranellaceae bacterium]
MKVLGLSFGFHDSAAALLIDGRIVAAGQEERFTRIKHDADFPRRAIEFCLGQAGISMSDVDRIVYYENALKKFDRIVWASNVRDQQKAKSGLVGRARTLWKVATKADDVSPYLESATHSWFKRAKFDAVGKICDELAVPREKVTYVDHHDSHLAAAFYTSPFDHAAIVTMDGVGEYETAVIAVGRGSAIERRLAISLPHSIGLFYSAFTAFLGFEVNEGEYKVMGMAAFGQPKHYDEVRKLITLRDDGGFEIEQSCFEFLTPETLPYTDEFLRRFGEPRQPEAEFAVQRSDLSDDLPEAEAEAILSSSRHYADLAASVQRCTEELVLHLAAKASAIAGTRNVCLAGGVALNSLANGRLIRECGYNLFVHPAAGDAGNAIGAAASYYHRTAKQPRMQSFASPYLGSPLDPAEIDAAIAASGFDAVTTCSSDEELVEHVAECLAGGAVIGWVQGQAEWGPRALGARSILADATNPAMKRIVNERVKFRELFRPFAPAVAAEAASQYFDFEPNLAAGAPEYYMLAVHPVRAEKKSLIPAITHADGSARVQIVTSASNPTFHALLKAFERRKGVPILMNTSFNLRGEPMVDSPRDAIRTFSISGIDYLVLGRTVVSSRVEL